MTYTVTNENLNKAIEMLAMLNYEVREMERKHGFNVTKYDSYNSKMEKLLDETVLISMILDTDVKEIDEMVNSRTWEFEESISQ